LEVNLKTLGVILAGGKSQRMGTNKAELLWTDGKTLLARATQLLEATGINHIVVSGDIEGGTPDRIPHLGPLSAIETIIHKHHPHKILVIPVDMPCLTATLLKRLLSKTPKHMARYYEDYPLPLVLPINNDIKRCIRRLMESSDPKKHSIRQLLDSIDSRQFHASAYDKQHLLNANTPEQWQQLIDEKKD